MDQGLESAGLDIRVCVEVEDDRVATIQANRPQWTIIHDDIQNVATASMLRKAGLDVGEAFMVAGGPPCAPFSKSAYWVNNRTKNIFNDPRAKMLYEFLRVVLVAKPKTFLLENVSGLSYKTSRDVLLPFLEALIKAGYNPQCAVLNAVDYGVPQKRKRFFVIGARSGIRLTFPKATHAPPSDIDDEASKKWITAGEAIDSLDDKAVHEEEKIGGKYGHLLEEIPPGDNYLYFTKERGHPDPKFKWRSRFWTFLLKLSQELPSWTIQANPAKYQGPFHWNNRHLRVNELKALQCIPSSWKIVGSKTSVRSQIGDACPPLLSETITKGIIEQRIN